MSDLPQPSADGNPKRSARRQCLVVHLHDVGPRPVLEALIAVENGQSLDHVLEDFGRVPVSVYHDVGADVLPIERLQVVKGDAA
jgi:hypothetical protein